MVIYSILRDNHNLFSVRGFASPFWFIRPVWAMLQIQEQGCSMVIFDLHIFCINVMKYLDLSGD